MVLTMTEAVRQKLVFGILEDLLEPNKRSVVNVWSAAQPLSGDEFEQVRMMAKATCACSSPASVRACTAKLSRARVGGDFAP